MGRVGRCLVVVGLVLLGHAVYSAVQRKRFTVFVELHLISNTCTPQSIIVVVMLYYTSTCHVLFLMQIGHSWYSLKKSLLDSQTM